MDKNLITGIEDIDEQHKNLFLTVKLFGDNKPQKEILWDILLDIERYSRLHFETEEGYMFKYAYPELEQHKLEHEKFTEKFTELKVKFETTGFSDEFVDEFQNFLLGWLDNHYKYNDVKMAEFLKTKLGQKLI